MNRYVYKPYHGWRHGYRREIKKKWMLRIVKLILAAEGVILTMRYVKTHTYENVYEREVMWNVKEMIEAGSAEGNSGDDRNEPKDNGEIFAIGYEPEDHQFFWLHKKTESETEISPEP